MTELERIISHYAPLAAEAIAVIESGQQYKFTNSTEWFFWDKDVTARIQAIFSMMYDTVANLRRQNPSLLSKIGAKAANPVIDDVIAFVAEEEFDNSKQRFIEKLAGIHTPTGRGVHMKTISHIRTYLFLEALNRHPDMAERIDETSAYFPHRLFVEKTRTISMADVEREIAAVLPTLYSPKLIEIISRMREFIETPGAGGERFGDYVSYPGFRWIKGANPVHLDIMLRQQDVKHEIFYTLADCLAVTQQTAKERQKKVRNLPNFGLSWTHYGVVSETIRAYARNQMLSVYRETEGKVFADTYLTRHSRLTGRIEGDTLLITDNYHHSTERLNMFSNFANTTSNLPLCAFLLNRFYWRAEEINAKSRT